MKTVVVSGFFDDIRSRTIQFLDSAARFGEVYVQLWSEELTKLFISDINLKFPLAERMYILRSIRYVKNVSIVDQIKNQNCLDVSKNTPHLWVMPENEVNQERISFCNQYNIKLLPIADNRPIDFSDQKSKQENQPGNRKRVIVTGCFDWLHSGHIRFFEEVSQYGDLYVALGNDYNIRLLKGEGHPLFPAAERRYMVQSIRYVTQAVISSGTGWMDAAPEIAMIQPDIYAVNEDGDKPEKKEFCAKNGLEYLILKRTPKPGLPKRQSTDLRGF